MTVTFSMKANELLAARLATDNYVSDRPIQFRGVHLEVGYGRIMVFASNRKSMVCFVSPSGHVAGNDSGKNVAFFVPSMAIDQLKVLEEKKVYFALLPCGLRFEMRCGNTTVTLDYGKVPVPDWKKLVRKESGTTSNPCRFPVDPILLTPFAAMRPLLFPWDSSDGELPYEELIIEFGESVTAPCRIYLDGISNFIGLVMPRAFRSDQSYSADFIGVDEKVAEVLAPCPKAPRPSSRMFVFD